MKKCSKILSLILSFVLIACYFAVISIASDNTSITTVAENSVYEVFPVEITHLETQYRKNSGTACFVYWVSGDKAGSFRVSNEEYARLKEGETVQICRLKDNENNSSVVLPPSSDIYLEDVVVDDGKYYAVISDGEKIKISKAIVSDLKINQSLTQQKNGKYKELNIGRLVLEILVPVLILLLLIIGIVFLFITIFPC